MIPHRSDDVASTAAEVNEINARLKHSNLVIIDASYQYGEFIKKLYQVCHKIDIDDIDQILSRLLHNILEMQRNPSIEQIKHYVDSADLILSEHGITDHGEVIAFWLSVAMLVTSRFILDRLRDQSDCWILAGNVNGVFYIRPERGLSSAHIET